jgi:EAL domain-containing protein (putative c-di-GMP-specific phosphodiesterase class I)
VSSASRVGDSNQGQSAHPSAPRRSPAPTIRLDPEHLGMIARRLQSLPIDDMIQQQTARTIDRDGKVAPVFREIYVSMGDLRERIAPRIDLFANRWLFQHLTEFLDKQLLAYLARQGGAGGGDQPISVNLNISTIESAEFRRFHAVRRQRPDQAIVEVQLIDILADWRAYAEARDCLRHLGYHVLLDGLTPLTPQLVEVASIDTDLVKLWWSRELPERLSVDRIAVLRRMLDHYGSERVILARVDSLDALRWGLTLGIQRFQGFLIDRLAKAQLPEVRP